MEYKQFLSKIKQKINEKEFIEYLNDAQKIDSKYYEKKIFVSDLEKIIEEYEKKDVKKVEFESILVFDHGSPEEIFMLCIEAVRQNLNMEIIIHDFCVAQDIALVEFMNDFFKNNNVNKSIKLKNVLSVIKMIEIAKKSPKTIVIGNSNLYNRLKLEKIENVTLNPYSIVNTYCDKEYFEELEELEEMIFKVIEYNEYQVDDYSELDLDEAISLINRDGLDFCTIFLTKDEEKIKKFKEKIKSKYYFINENPFNKMKFEL